MKDPRSKVLCCLIVFFALSSCTYSPEEEFFKNIVQPDPQATISLNTFNNADTIYLYDAATFSFNVGVDQGEIEKVEVLLDEEPLQTYSSSSGTFNINYQSLRTGNFELKVQFTATTGSGSLAEVSGGEKLLVWRTWTLSIDVEPPPKPELELSAYNGFLRLDWTAYTKPNFVEYYVVSSQENETKKVVRIKNQNQTYWIDSSYVGGMPVSYRVGITAQGNANSDPKERNDPQTFVLTYRNADSTVTLTWRKAPFESSVKEYVIEENNNVKWQITNVLDTAIVFKPDVIYRAPLFFRLKVIPKYPSTYYLGQNFRAVAQPVASNKISHGAGALYYNSGINSIIGYSNPGTPQLSIYNEEMQIAEAIELDYATFSVPYTGVLAYIVKDRRVVQVNLLNKERKSYHLQMPTPNYDGPSRMSGASNGTVSFGYHYNRTSTLPETWFGTVYSMADNQTIYHHQVVAETANVVSTISDDGKYLRFPDNEKIYQINGGTLELIGEFPVNWFVDFRPDDSEEILVSGAGGLEIYNTIDLTLNRTITPPSGYVFYSFDPVTKYALFMRPNTKEQFFINIDTQETVPVKFYYSGNDMTYSLLNGILFSEDGQYIKIF